MFESHISVAEQIRMLIFKKKVNKYDIFYLFTDSNF